MKTIIEMAREAFKFPDAVVWDAWMPSLERFAALVEAAHTERLLAGVEMPEPALPKGIGVSASFHIDYFTADQLRETVASAVLRKDAEIDTLKAENERLRADAARYQWLRGNHRSAPQHKLTWYLPMNYPRTDNGLDAAIDAAMKGQP